jgi:hypothetical protein
MNGFITYLSIFSFLVLYIICFVFIFNKNKEVISFVALTFFHFFFILYIIQTFSLFLNKQVNFITIFAWAGIFISLIFKLIGLILLLVTFSHFNLISVKKGKKDKKLPSNFDKKLKNYKIIFQINMVFIGVLILSIVSNYHALNINFWESFKRFLNDKTFKPLVFPFIIIISNLLTMALASYEIYLGDYFMKLKNKTIS